MNDHVEEMKSYIRLCLKYGEKIQYKYSSEEKKRQQFRFKQIDVNGKHHKELQRRKENGK